MGKNTGNEKTLKPCSICQRKVKEELLYEYNLCSICNNQIKKNKRFDRESKTWIPKEYLSKRDYVNDYQRKWGLRNKAKVDSYRRKAEYAKVIHNYDL